jgi:putative ABC transport system substrate-binding protein
MKRRDFITILGGAAATWPIAARAQQVERIRRIGVLHSLTEDNPVSRDELQALRQGLEAEGWKEGRNLQIYIHFDTENAERRRSLAKELVALGPDVIVTRATPTTAAVAQETRVIPIVFAMASDPVGSGFAASLPRPGGNITGFLNYESSLGSKWLELLKHAVPKIRRVGVPYNPQTAVDQGQYFLRSIENAGRKLQLNVVETPLREASEIEPALRELARTPNTGLVVIPDLFNSTNRMQIILAAAQSRLPAVYPGIDFARPGGLLAYGIDSADLFRRAASYVSRILKGEKPSDLPVQAPVKFELVINLKTAGVLGLTIPPGVLAIADEVIE